MSCWIINHSLHALTAAVLLDPIQRAQMQQCINWTNEAPSHALCVTGIVALILLNKNNVEPSSTKSGQGSGLRSRAHVFRLMVTGEQLEVLTGHTEKPPPWAVTTNERQNLQSMFCAKWHLCISVPLEMSWWISSLRWFNKEQSFKCFSCFLHKH